MKNKICRVDIMKCKFHKKNYITKFNLRTNKKCLPLLLLYVYALCIDYK